MVGDPRWDRVAFRAQKGSARAHEVMRAFENLPRPWTAWAQAWKEDVAIWQDSGFEGAKSGTHWVIPHSLSKSELEDIEGLLSRRGLYDLRTSQAHSNPKVSKGSAERLPREIAREITREDHHVSWLMKWDSYWSFTPGWIVFS